MRSHTLILNISSFHTNIRMSTKAFPSMDDIQMAVSEAQ